MCNETIPAASPAANLPPCPPWCDPRCCEVTESDVLHQGTPVRLETVDALYELALTRADELAFPSEWDRPPSLYLYVESRAYAAAPGSTAPWCVSTDLALDEVPALIAALTGRLRVAGAEPEPDPVWTEAKVQDAVSNATASLLGSGVLDPSTSDSAARAAVTQALKAAGITPGSIR